MLPFATPSSATVQQRNLYHRVNLCLRTLMFLVLEGLLVTSAAVFIALIFIHDDKQQTTYIAWLITIIAIHLPQPHKILKTEQLNQIPMEYDAGTVPSEE